MIKKHLFFWIGFSVFLVTVIITLLFTDKGDTLLYFNQFRNPLTVDFFRFFSFIVEYPIFIFLFIFFLFYSYRTSILIGMTGLISLVIVAGLKTYFAAPRPYLFYSDAEFSPVLALLDGYTPIMAYTSFPSGHTTAAFAIFSALALSIQRKYTDVIFIALAILSGVSRVFLANHFMEDILFGSLLGVSVTLMCNVLLEKLKIPKNKALINWRRK